MTLSSLVVSRDWAEVSVLQCILGSLHIGVDVETEPQRALDILAKSKIDALIVDSDLAGTPGLLRGLEDSFFQNTVPLVILSGPSGQRDFDSKDATFVFQKPISVEQAVRTLSAARNMILNGRLRYHRQPLDSPISVTFNRKDQMQASLLNVSQGGVRLHAQKALPDSGPVRIDFALPGSKRSLKLEGEVVWRNGHGDAGIRFLAATNVKTKRNLQIWLEQQYLTN